MAESYGALGGAGFVPETGDDLVAGERGEGQRLNESCSRLGHHDVHFEGLALQVAHQFSGLVSSDSARDAYGDSHGSIVEQGTAGQGSVRPVDSGSGT